MVMTAAGSVETGDKERGEPGTAPPGTDETLKANEAPPPSEPSRPQAPEPVPSPSEPQAAEASPRRGRWIPIAWAASLILAVGLGVAVTWFLLDGRIKAVEDGLALLRQASQTTAQQVDTIERRAAAHGPRIEAFAAEIAQLRGELATLSGETSAEGRATQAALAQRLAAAEKEIGTITGQTELTQALKERVGRLETEAVRAAALEQRLKELEGIRTTVREGSTRAAATALAVSRLKHALESGARFGDALAAVRLVAGDDAEMVAAVSVLEPMAENGVPTVASLRNGFPAVAREAIVAEAAVTGEDWLDRILHRLSSAITIRQTGDAAIAAGGTEGAIALAERALAAGDLAAAADALAAVDGPAAPPLAPWLNAAKARVDADRSIARLEAGAVARLANVRGS
jgi:hypothetical protein